MLPSEFTLVQGLDTIAGEEDLTLPQKQAALILSFLGH